MPLRSRAFSDLRFCPPERHPGTILGNKDRNSQSANECVCVAGSRVGYKRICPEILVEKLIELRKDFGLHDDTQMLVMLSISTKDMNRYVSMYPEVWFIDCTAGESY